jgi:hypothetical protein
MTGADILAEFNIYTDDQSELSETEAYSLLNKKYNQVLSDRDWEFLRKKYSGTMSTSVPYVALPSDFRQMMWNYKNMLQEPEIVVYVGSGNNPDVYRVVPKALARQYEDLEGYCYIDMVNSRLVFTKQPTAAEAIDFDYAYVPDAIEAATSPVFRAAFHNMLSHAMAMDFEIIESAEQGFSQKRSNQEQYESYLSDLRNEDSRIKENF